MTLICNCKEGLISVLDQAEILTDIPLDDHNIIPLQEVNGNSLLTALEELELFSLVKQVPSFCAAFSKGGYSANQVIVKTRENNKYSSEVEQSSAKMAVQDNEFIPIIL